ncbi:MAG: N-6 DNA methylase, partial [Dysgonamonadaceae bacterium]|nr:N-6 DNA methylase [Dysgonamonadaceae bacterium]
MSNRPTTDYIKEYIAELDRIYKGGNATEHTYRFALKSLLEKIASIDPSEGGKLNTELTVTNEPKRIACGAPDYIITRKEIPIGYIEAKDIDTDLNSNANKEQFDRYKQSLNNLIITDYLTFQLFVNDCNDDVRHIATVKIARTTKNGIEADKTQFDTFVALINLFVGYQGKEIQTSIHLSKIMAAKALLLANIIENALNENEGFNSSAAESNSLYGQLTGFREILIKDISHKDFADIYAQTIAYGMFAAKFNDKITGTFTRGKAAQLISKSNPFLRKLFNYVAGFDLDERIFWVVDDLADLFNYVDINAIIKEFEETDHDPIIHFYETFLAEYDPALRKSRGVWYTPKPVVQFIVQAVDDILKNDFRLSEGLADMSKVTLNQNIKQNDGTLKKEEKDYHRVQILDPATGTGAFLAEVVQNIYQRFKSQKGMWQSYANAHLIPRINGFEILMASYAMAHLNLELILKQTGYKLSTNERLQIYLTNSLHKAQAKTEIPFAKWLSDEANEANRIKQDVPVMVVIGNPPYSVSSQNKSTWINNLLADYKQGLNERNIQPLSDDYIKFIRYGQYFIEKNGSGILAYISNNSFIDGLIHRQMRKNLLKTFDKIYILDLHGNTKKKETAPDGTKDENVFDIQQGVSINIFVKTSNSNTPADVYHNDLYGKRTEKYNFLLNNNLKTIPWQQIQYFNHNCFFVPKDFELKEEYEKGFKVSELFSVYSSGIKTHDDANLVSFVPFAKNNQLLAYRPFDIRYINYDLKKVQRHRYKVMQHFINGENIGFVTSRQFGSQKHFICLITNKLLEISSQPFAPYYVFPLYLYIDGDIGNNGVRMPNKKIPNLNISITKEISQCLGLPFTEEKEETKNTFAPIDISDYIYAILHSPAYREKYKEFLKIDFPRVPYPENGEKFWNLVEIGGKLRRLHLLEDVEPQEDIANYPIAGSNEIEKPSLTLRSSPKEKGCLPLSEELGKVGRVYINDTQYFDNVPLTAWNFYIG